MHGREKSDRHSSDEGGEQSRVTGGGAGGAKGGGRGKRDRRHMRAGHSTGAMHDERLIAAVALAAINPRWEPYAGKPHVRICAGGAQQ